MLKEIFFFLFCSLDTHSAGCFHHNAKKVKIDTSNLNETEYGQGSRLLKVKVV